MLAKLRAIKAEGGWGVVCTEYNSIHPSSDDLPHPSASLWDDVDIRNLARMTDMVHEHGALAGAELWYGGSSTANLMTREIAMDLDSLPNQSGHPYQTRRMDKEDIRNLRRWHRKAAIRARDAGFDLVYVYATHGYLLSHFLNPRTNTRCDEYGGSLENRVRLVREIIKDTKDAVGDRCAIAVRFAADETIGKAGEPIHGERRETFAMLAELPDLWDINIASYTVEMGVARFTGEAALEPYMTYVRSMTSKPVVTVGRFTSPDTMVSQIRRGVTDFIGAARPSIADPFLPRKIETGDIDDIRECIGCNVCYSGDSLSVPIRCTQNPTMGEEWRKGWHPEEIDPKRSESSVLVVGAGPAGMEAARALGRRGYQVTLAEERSVLGGRLVGESALPGMSTYIRVRDYRAQSFHRMPNVEVFIASRLTAEDVMEFGADHVVIATGATWRKDRFDGLSFVPIADPDAFADILTPDDVMAGRLPDSPTLVYDEDHYYMGGVIAEKLRAAGLEVVLATPSEVVSKWAEMTTERWLVRTRLMELGVDIVTSHSLSRFDGSTARLQCEFTGKSKEIGCSHVVMVTQRRPNDALYRDLLDSVDGNFEKLPFSLKRIGDCDAPAIVASAVYAGHRYARELDEMTDVDEPLRHDRVDTGAFSNHSAPPDGATRAEYLETLLLYYEEEIEGEVFFEELAKRFSDPARKEALNLLSKVENHTANAMRPLIDKHGLGPRSVQELQENGRIQAAEITSDWAAMIDNWRKTFPIYVNDFLRLEAMAPPEDLPALRIATAHEVVAVDYLARAAADDPDPTAPLRHFLATGQS